MSKLTQRLSPPRPAAGRYLEWCNYPVVAIATCFTVELIGFCSLKSSQIVTDFIAGKYVGSWRQTQSEPIKSSNWERTHLLRHECVPGTICHARTAKCVCVCVWAGGEKGSFYVCKLRDSDLYCSLPAEGGLAYGRYCCLTLLDWESSKFPYFHFFLLSPLLHLLQINFPPLKNAKT